MKPETGRPHPNLVSLVVSELRGLNFEFEREEGAALRIIELVEADLMQSKRRCDLADGPLRSKRAPVALECTSRESGALAR